MDKFNEVLTLWRRGAILLVLLAVSLAGGAVLVSVPLLIVGAFLDWSDRDHLTWLVITSTLWAPVWAGFAAKEASDQCPPIRRAETRKAPAGQ